MTLVIGTINPVRCVISTDTWLMQQPPRGMPPVEHAENGEDIAATGHKPDRARAKVLGEVRKLGIRQDWPAVVAGTGDAALLGTVQEALAENNHKGFREFAAELPSIVQGAGLKGIIIAAGYDDTLERFIGYAIMDDGTIQTWKEAHLAQPALSTKYLSANTRKRWNEALTGRNVIEFHKAYAEDAAEALRQGHYPANAQFGGQLVTADMTGDGVEVTTQAFETIPIV